MANRDMYEFVSIFRGYHECQSVWSAAVGEELQCRIELSNPQGLFAVAVCKLDGAVVSHVLRFFSSICSSFLRRKGYHNLQSNRPQKIFG